MRFFTRQSGQQIVLELDGAIIAIVEVSVHDKNRGHRVGVFAAPNVKIVTAETVEPPRISQAKQGWRDLYRKLSKRL